MTNKINFQDITDKIRVVENKYINEAKKLINEAFLRLKNEIKSVDIKRLEFTIDLMGDDNGGSTVYVDSSNIIIDKDKMNKIITDKNITIDNKKKLSVVEDGYSLEVYCEDQFDIDSVVSGLTKQIFNEDEINLLGIFFFDFLHNFDNDLLDDILE